MSFSVEAKCCPFQFNSGGKKARKKVLEPKRKTKVITFKTKGDNSDYTI